MRNFITGRLMAGSLLAIAGAPAAAQTALWTRQAGTPVNDQGYGVAVDSAGNAYIGGYTNGDLGGTSAGGYDYFLSKYDAAGTLLWARQGGTAQDENGYGVAVDDAGHAYVAGFTGGSLAGPNAGSNDMFLARYDASGTLLWTRQSGTSATDQGYGVIVDDAGNAYVTGYSTGSLGGPNAGGFDAVLLKYDASGTLLWTRQAAPMPPTSALAWAWTTRATRTSPATPAGALAGPARGASTLS